jgi:hypothetical protein
MAKRTGSYDSLIRGVSEQVAHDRLPGQHWTQTNMISDPVRGLARRHGSVMLDEALLPGAAYSEASKEDASNFKEVEVTIGGTQYSLMYRPVSKPVGSTLPGVICVDKDAGSFVTVSIDPADAEALSAVEGGLSSVTAVGRFVVAAVQGRNTTFSELDQLSATNTTSVVWVKGGAYSRNFTVNCYPASGPVVTVTYKTMPSYFPGILDTSDILTTDPDYQKKVNDRTHAYQTAVNQHIGDAAADIQPENIAEELRLLLVAAGVTVTRTGSHLLITGPVNVTVDDSGDGSFMKAVAVEVETASDLSDRHVVGKVVRVVPRQTGAAVSPSYYLKAEAKTAGLSGMQEVVWRETAGYQYTPLFVFLLGAIVGNTLYLASSVPLLEAVSGLLDIPPFLASSAGDADSSPKPEFLGSPISYVREFQDRLMIVSRAIVFLSKSGDYFNFFRASALTVADDDPIEVFAEGSDGDVITDGVKLDRSLILFGKKQQYAIQGREAIFPRNAFVATQSAYEDANTAPAVAAGNLVFFTQKRNNRLTLQQLQPGAYADSFDAFDASSQLDGYLRGTPKQILALTSPSMLFIRTREERNALFVYSFLDSPGGAERLFDSWSKWEWATSLGVLVGASTSDSTLLTVTLRDGVDGVALVLDQFSRETRLSEAPYLDSLRPWSTAQSSGSIQPGWVGEDDTAIALGSNAGVYRLIGRPLAQASTLIADIPVAEDVAVVGALFEAETEPTAPYIRTREGRAILDSRLTVTKLIVTVADTSALRTALRGISTDVVDEELGIDWIARPLGNWVLNTQQIVDTASITVPVLKEVRDYRLRLFSRNWLPLTLSSIEWSGQFFTTRRG